MPVLNTAAKILFVCVLVLFPARWNIYSQSNGDEKKFYDPAKKFSVTAYGMFISSAVVLNNINSKDPIERDISEELDGTYGYGLEFNYEPRLFNLDLVFYLSTEYIKITQDVPYRVDNGMGITTYKTTERFELIPLEFGIKWPLPVSTDNFKIYIGGGSGFYFGKQKRVILNLESQSIENKPGFSLNILAGVEYYIARNLSANLEFKFREASFDAQGKYNKRTFLPEPFYTRFLADGTRLSIGFKYHF
ncbi:MAG: hypothetical protein EHM58_19305 [Ignavibacteriae bacterium]|nr:MAG: hypothetical protein EHM58_19305 [Ignavibacteriota bacterium]